MSTAVFTSLPKPPEVSPAIQTEIVEVEHLRFIKVTVLFKSLRVTAFSDAIGESVPLQDYARQATRRAMQYAPGR